MRKTSFIFALAIWFWPNIGLAQQDTDQPTKQNAEQAESVANDGKHDSKSDSIRDKSKSLKWGLYPGMYQSWRKDQYGLEVSALYENYGVALGFNQGELRYAEIEGAWWLLSLGVGAEFRDDEVNPQITYAAPILPIFPYGRHVLGDQKREEYGFMLKLPIMFFE